MSTNTKRSTTRRNFLVTSSAVTAGAAISAPMILPALAADQGAADPIFAAIDHRRDVFAAYENALQLEGRRFEEPAQLAAAEEASNELCYADAEAVRQMLATVPTTLAGAVALLSYVTTQASEGDCLLEIDCRDDDGGDDDRQGYHALLPSLLKGLKGLAATPID